MKLNWFALISLILAAACNQPVQQSLEPLAFQTAMNKTENKIILDVRTPEEFKMGYLPEAQNLNIYERDFENRLSQLDKNKTVFVYCKSGGRSDEAALMLKKQGFENVVLLNGGLMNWENQGLTIIPGIMTRVVAEYTLDQYHEEIAAYPLVMVDFFAEWCGPCKMMEPTMKKLKENYTEEQLKIIKVDVDHNPDIAAYYKVNSIPVLKVYHNGELKHDIVGYQSEEQIMEMVGPLM